MNLIQKHSSLIKAVILAGLFAVFGGLLVGNSFEGWFQEINHPWYSIPLAAWYVVGALYYLMLISVLYRIFKRQPGRERNILLTLTLLMAAYNESWNYLLFGLKSPFAGFFGLLPFIALVLVLFVKLLRSDRTAAYILTPYVVWLVYDIFWAYGLWRLNL